MGLFDFLKKKEETITVIQETKVTPEMEMTKKVSLEKREITVGKVILEKFPQETIKAKVICVMDVSGSMHGMFVSGVVQNTLERLFPIARKFDDDGELDMYLFSENAIVLPPMTMDNFQNYVNTEILIKNHKSLWNGTSYSPVMKKIMEDNCNYNLKSNAMTYVIFITDGDNDDKKESENIIREASEHAFFWQFVGIGNCSFTFLKTLDNLTNRKIDNANFFSINNITEISDESLYNKLLNEFPSWIKEAKNSNIIK